MAFAPRLQARQAPFVIRNEGAMFLWGFMAVWMAILAAVTGSYVRHVDLAEAVRTRYAPLVLAGFWLVGLLFSGFALSRKRLEFRIEADGRVILKRKGVLTQDRWEGRAGDVAGVRLAEDRDSDGDPYFRCDVVLPCGTVTVAEGHRRPVVEATRRDIEERLRGV